MQTNFSDIHQAYTLISQEYIDEVKSQAALLRHNQSGAVIVALSNDDDNKVFSIGFRTPPKDSTGVAHILEHSVLCGSKNFPVKDPFVELVKGSLNTFLNAITFPDKTIYPVASCNDKDFQNLMHVYMDSVFYPNIYQRKEIFLQEGWHYEMEDMDSDLIYNGVVYNEMKGAMSSPEQVLSEYILAQLFPETTYGFNSGGDPDHIPELTYEQFLDFHRTYYHPSNAYIYLYGDMDMQEKLDFMDREYLGHFDQIHVDSEIALQSPFEQAKDVVAEYSIGSEDDENDSTYLSYNVVFKDSRDAELYAALQMLDYALMSCPGAPLKKALIESGIGKDAYCETERSICQPFMSIVVKNSNESEKARFVEIIDTTLKRIVKEGVNKDSLNAALNSMEFKFREADYGSAPSGLMYALPMFDSWLYDKENPFTHLKCFGTFNALREKIETGYFEDLICRYILDNPHKVILTLKPKKGLVLEKEQAQKELLAQKKASMTPEEREAVVKETAHLKEYQETPSTQEELETIPMLTIDDINKKPIPLKNESLMIGGFKGLYHEYETKGIVYIRLIFDMSGLPVRLIPYAKFLASVLGNVNTKKYDYEALNNAISMYTGGVYTGVSVYGRKDNDDYTPCFEVSGRALVKELEKMTGLMQEMMFESVLDDKKRLRELIDETISQLQMRFYSSGHSVAVSRATSYFAESGAYKEMLGGIDYYHFVQKLSEDFEDSADVITASLKETLAFIFRKDNIMADVTVSRPYLETVSKTMESFAEKLFENVPEKEAFNWAPESKNEGFITPGMVQYDALAGDFSKGGFKFHGGLSVLKVILEYEYLWINLRVKGGAYGCMNGFSRNGNTYFTSYRDPKLGETFDVYKNCAEFVRNFDASDRDMLKYIIGAVSASDTPLMPYGAAARSLGAYFSGLTDEELQQSRDELLGTNVETIRSFAPLIDCVVSQNTYCVVGSESKIRENDAMFNHIESL